MRAGRGQSPRRLANVSTLVDDEHDEIEVPYGWAWDLASEITSYGADVVVVSPPEVRERVVELLRVALEEVMSKSRQQVVRMLALVPYLRGQDGIPVYDVAEEFGVAPNRSATTSACSCTPASGRC